MPPPYRFANPKLEALALTHKSFATPHNERLEWLGDAVLELEVSRLLYERFADVAEGGLSMIRYRLVCGKTLAQLARRLQLPPRLKLGKNLIDDGRDNDNILAGAMEAYIAAIYLDGGDIRQLLDDWLSEDITTLGAIVQEEGLGALREAKSQLQEKMQQQGYPPPSYTVVRTEGKPHCRVFFVECRLADGRVAEGTARSRSEAEQAAAALLLTDD